MAQARAITEQIATGQPQHSIRIFPPWCVENWETVDDRIRGGKSISFLRTRNRDGGVVFSGTLDTTALGGAGFASQRYQFPGGPLHVPSPEYAGMRIELDPTTCSHHTPKEFTFILATTPITRRPDGRANSRTNWEATFTNSQSSFDLPFDAFKATYRGRPVEPAPVLDTTNVFDVSVMCRSGFGAQAGEFELGILSIEAIIPPS
ncbi:hypothetical protein FRC12_004445 [Ceratobasidium sp. 428]|nr:hypothetical protein FRC12_004445 [Ceratobasidium sp. 428]